MSQVLNLTAVIHWPTLDGSQTHTVCVCVCHRGQSSSFKKNAGWRILADWPITRVHQCTNKSDSPRTVSGFKHLKSNRTFCSCGKPNVSNDVQTLRNTSFHISKGAFHLVTCRYDFRERVKERGRTVSVVKHHFYLSKDGGCSTMKTALTLLGDFCFNRETLNVRLCATEMISD